MRVLVRAALSAAACLVAALPAGAQQGSVQISSETQFVASDRLRKTDEVGVQPDFGISWVQPGARFGQFQMEARGTRRGDAFHVGRTWIALRDAKTGHVTWTLEAGHLHTATSTDYQFANLSAPAFTIAGGSAVAKTSHLTVQIVGGQATALRNIFGSDPERLGQSFGLARGTYQPGSRVQVIGRAARVRTSNLKEFTQTVDASDEIGGGTRVTITPSIQAVADAGYVRYRASGATAPTPDYSYLFGTHVLLAHGWAQVNASRFSPGEMPVLNASLQDRGGIFAAGEYDVFRIARAFGGWDSVDTNINPSGSALLRPQGTVTRGFGGVRVRVGSRSSVSLRLEDGGRVSKPVLPGVPVSAGVPTTSDTGVISADWQGNYGVVTAFARYSRRQNVDVSTSSANFTQHDSSGQIFVNVSKSTQLFGVTTVTRQESIEGGGSTFLQITGGAQRRVFTPGLWMRLEGSTSTNRDLSTGLLAPRDALTVGLNGQITRQTSIGLNVYVDRTSVGTIVPETGWMSRATLRVVHTIPTGSVRVNSAIAGTADRQIRGSGSLLGVVFADWNGNGLPDPGEPQLADIPLHLGTSSHVTTGRDGQFSFINVPAGTQQVGLELNALPVDFDPPTTPEITLDLARGATRRVAFGLVPLGSIQGRIVEDSNRNGLADAGEPAVTGAVVTLDGGQRSELAEKGLFRFDAVRSGDHRVELLKESLPEGSVIQGGTERDAALTREHPNADVQYLITIEKRPEVRKVFPPRVGANKPSPRGPGSAAPAAKPAVAAAHAPPPPGPQGTDSFTVQIAALINGGRARSLVERLKRAGFDAYLVEPRTAGARDEVFRVRVGRFATKTSAQETAVKLQRQLGERPWVARE